MAIELAEPDVADLGRVLDSLRGWQHDGAPVQLHPGDVGWHWRFGAEATAAAVRTWSRDDRIVAVGMRDGPDLLRMAIAPDADHDVGLAERLVADLTGVLPVGVPCVEARFGGALRNALAAAGWVDDEPWTPLVRDLAERVRDVGLRVRVVGPELVEERCAVQVAAFDGSTFTPQRWHAMAAGPAYADARCLVGYDDDGVPVAVATVWSAGPGRPGLLEPVGVHRDHRGRGHGTAITLAAAAALQEMGASSATVCTPSANVGGVATYVAAGFRALPEVADLRRGAR